MATMLDVILSTVLGGMLFMIILTTNEIALERSSVHKGDQIVQETSVALSLFVDGEIRNMGFGVKDTQLIVLRADSNLIMYRTDRPPLDVLDTIMFFVGGTSELSGTPNKSDRFLYWKLNSEAPIPVGVVTFFRFRYINRAEKYMRSPVSSDSLSHIFRVETTTEIQNPYAIYKTFSDTVRAGQEALYSSILWSQTRMTSNNLHVSARPAVRIRRNPPSPGPPSPMPGTTVAPRSRPPRPPRPTPVMPPPPPPPRIGVN